MIDQLYVNNVEEETSVIPMCLAGVTNASLSLSLDGAAGLMYNALLRFTGERSK